ncbi:CoA ester lyase [Variovorax sp. J22R24]|uniref:HpcH/HpaI aldolase/citrate lyase family protein n=1 Tax=Variovorax gracilis TaxID=3053502 RepID=UPI002576E494|nr:CoA ester lyase [Variovorax sp. J22R24]MDM0106570.1 CoA ester lyase [Variovorax sp. J22R24]
MRMIKDARTLLFVPAISPHLIEKATGRGADVLIVDLEDSVPIERKVEARQMASQAISRLAGQTPVLLRVNSSADLLRADIEAMPLAQIDGVLLPKVESAAQVVALAELLAHPREGQVASLPIAALIETPLGVMRVESIASAHPSVSALGFGAEDYASEMRVEPRPESLLWAAQTVTNCARAFGLACWGLPGSVAEINDMDAFADLVRLGRSIGFSGTVCIHPRQIAPANSGFGPTTQELEWARKVLAAAAEAQAKGVGAISLDGRMIDRPIVERAKRLIRP